MSRLGLAKEDNMLTIAQILSLLFSLAGIC